jgi:hypothetical protein
MQGAVGMLKKTNPNATIRQNSEIRAYGVNERIEIDGAVFRPDVVSVSQDEINIIEVSCPYDQMTSINDAPMTALEKVHRAKIAKYEPLRRRCEEVFQRRCKLTTVIVSSLGAVYKESVRELKKNIGLGDRALKTLVRRISTAALIGSYFVFNKFKPNSDRNQRNGEFRITNETVGNLDAEEPSDRSASADEC